MIENQLLWSRRKLAGPVSAKDQFRLDWLITAREHSGQRFKPENR
jgi:hypothetical protein